MHDRLKYELLPAQSAGYRLGISVPSAVWERHQANELLAQNLAVLTTKRNKAAVVETSDDATQLSFNDKRIGASTAKLKLIQAVNGVVTGLEMCANEEQQDLNLRVKLSRLPVGNTGRYRAYMQVRWPDLPDDQIAQIATRHMQDSALKLRYQTKAQIPGLVYGVVNRSTGVTLETNNLGCCHVGTDGSLYRPSRPRFELYAQNIYSPVQQLICLVGGVAIARAVDLVSAQPIC